MTQRNILYTLLSICTLGVAMWIGSYFQSTSFPFLHSSHKHPPLPLSIGVVDINSFKTNSKVFQKFQNAIEDLNATIHKEILEKETKLRTEFEQYKKQEEAGQTPTRESIKKKAEFDKKVAELEKIVRERRKELEQEYTHGLLKIKQTLKEIMDDLGRTHGLKIILNKSLGEGNQMDQSIVLFCSEGLDLTNEVIRLLDKQLLTKKLHD
jgi:Skp family chaperone for outer membrane proteins